MKIGKMVSEKVVAANRANAQKSTGPRRTEAVSGNAVTHGLLAKKMVLDEGQRVTFNTLLYELEADYMPLGRMEHMMIEEMTTCILKMQDLNGLEQKTMDDRKKASEAILGAVADDYDYQRLQLFSRRTDRVQRLRSLGNARS